MICLCCVPWVILQSIWSLGFASVPVLASYLWSLQWQSVDSTMSSNDLLYYADLQSESELFGQCHAHHHMKRKLDTAWLTVDNKLDHNVTLFAQVHQCWKCPLLYICDVRPGHSMTTSIDTKYSSHVVLGAEATNNTVDPYCQQDYHYRENGTYNYLVEYASGTQDDYNCTHVANTDTVINSLLPVYISLGLFAFLAVLYFLGSVLQRKYSVIRMQRFFSTETLVSNDLGTPTNSSSVQDSQQKVSARQSNTRLRCLDTFRGLSLVIMIFVNYGGGEYWFFKHAAWNGLTVADLVFPWFVFIMGTSLALSMNSLLKKFVPKRTIAWKIVKRSCIIFMIGLMLSNGKRGAVHVSDLRIMGVLQRLGLTYLITALIHLASARIVLPDSDPSTMSLPDRFRDVLPYWLEWVMMFCVVLTHTLLTLLLPVDNCPTGYLGPGGLHDHGAHWNCTGGAAGVIDRAILGQSHTYQHATSMKIYRNTMNFDPEGLLGTLTSVFMCYLGLQAGKILTCYAGVRCRVGRWLGWALLTGAIGAGLCGFQQNEGLIPVNKNLWSLSYVLSLSSMAFVLLTICYIIIDVYKLWNGAPFFYPGMNSIVLYVGHELLRPYFPVTFYVPPTHMARILLHLYSTLLWVLVAGVMYYYDIFISI